MCGWREDRITEHPASLQSLPEKLSQKFLVVQIIFWATKNFLMCGSSTFPGIGIPPVAASGAMAANTILGSKFQKNLIEELGI